MRWLVPAGAGLLSAALFLSVALGSSGALILAYLAPLPLFGAALALGVTAGTVAGGAGAVAVAAVTGLVPATSFTLLLALPVVLLTRQALLSRYDADGGLEWYPPGLLVTWLCGIGVTAFIVGALWLAGGEIGPEAQLRTFFTRNLGGLIGARPDQGMRAAVQVIAAYPAFMIISWLGMLAINGVLAQGLLSRFDRQYRPSPRVDEIELPRAVAYGAIGAGLVAIVADGWLAFVGRNLLVTLAVAFFFAGLAVVHGLTRRVGARLLLLAGFYMLVLFGWLIPLVVLLGFVDQWAHFRRRFRVGGGGGS